MTDVFISYKAEERARVAPLVDALSADGLSVWWDAHIAGGENWQGAIERALDAARVIVVVWSARSVAPEGGFVRDEARRAVRRGAYLPVRLDAVEPPLGFGEVQALSLIDWKGDRADPRYAAVVAAVRARLAGEAAAPPPAWAAPAPRVPRRAVVAGGAALGAAALGGGLWWATHGGGMMGGAASDSVAVLPFANLSGDPAQAYFSDGIAEELRGALTRINQLKVAARTSSELMRDADAQTAAHKLGVANILTGSVRRGANTIRVSAELVDGKTGLSRWSQAYDRASGDALAIEAGIAESVASALQIALGRAQKALLTLGGTTNPAARDAFLRGQAATAEQDGDSALKDYDVALAADPNYAVAHASRAQVTTVKATTDLGGAALRAKMAEAEAEARQAVALAPGLGYPLSILGLVLQNRLDLRGAAQAHEAAYKASPGDASVLRSKAVFDSQLTGGDDSLALYRRAMLLDPLRPNAFGSLGAVLLRCGRTDEAIAELRPGLARLPKNGPARYTLAVALLVKGARAQALEVVAPLPPDDFERLTIEAVASADRAASDRAFAALVAQEGTQYQLAQVHAQRRQPGLAFAAIARAWNMVDPGLLTFKTDPLLALLRPDPRFGQWLRKIGFP